MTNRVLAAVALAALIPACTAQAPVPRKPERSLRPRTQLVGEFSATLTVSNDGRDFVFEVVSDVSDGLATNPTNTVNVRSTAPFGQRVATAECGGVTGISAPVRVTSYFPEPIANVYAEITSAPTGFEGCSPAIPTPPEFIFNRGFFFHGASLAASASQGSPAAAGGFGDAVWSFRAPTPGTFVIKGRIWADLTPAPAVDAAVTGLWESPAPFTWAAATATTDYEIVTVPGGTVVASGTDVAGVDTGFGTFASSVPNPTVAGGDYALTVWNKFGALRGTAKATTAVFTATALPAAVTVPASCSVGAGTCTPDGLVSATFAAPATGMFVYFCSTADCPASVVGYVSDTFGPVSTGTVPGILSYDGTLDLTLSGLPAVWVGVGNVYTDLVGPFDGFGVAVAGPVTINP